MGSPPMSLESLRETVPTVCAACDYSQQGLPPGTACPECGVVNEADVIQIAGWRRPPFFTWGIKGWLLASVVGGYLLVTVWHQFYSTRQSIEDWGSLLLMLALYGYLFSWFFRSRPPLRLRLSPRGWEVVEKRSLVRLRRWEPALPAKVEWIKGGLCRLRIDWKTPTMSNAGTQTFCFAAELAQAEAVKDYIDSQTRHLHLNPGEVVRTV